MSKCLLTVFAIAFVFSGVLLTVAVNAEDVKYSVAEWPEKGFGNHRAVLRVSSPADAVWAHIEWRRRDVNPEKKAVLVYDSKGNVVANCAIKNITREFGDIVFQPSSGAGLYYAYYLPYNPGTGNFDDPGTYFEPKDTSDPAWSSKYSALDLKTLPVAELVEIQARSDFERMDPMEVIATPEEVSALASGAKNANYLLFPEDRRFPIKMIDDIPLKWIRTGPSTSFSGTAQPNEYYVFQIGVFAAKQRISDLTLTYSGLKSSSGKTIPTSAFHCINLGGMDWLGKPIKKVFDVGKGTVRALWIGVQIPKDGGGVFTGNVKVAPKGMPATVVKLNINVEGEMLTDRGDSDLWRMARLRWLDSTLGLDDKVIPPYTPVRLNGNTVSILGRQIKFGPLGLPVSIKAGKEVLASPVSFNVVTASGAVGFSPVSTKVLKQAEGVVVRETASSTKAFDLKTSTRTEFDGTIFVRLSLKAKKNVAIKDINLKLPLEYESSKYMVGFSKRGGFRPVEWKWKWDIGRPDNMVWLGDWNAGVQFKLMTDKDLWQIANLKDSGLPKGWSNGGKGGCDVSENDDCVLVNAYSGSRTMKAGESVEYRFRLMVTPFRPLGNKHWNLRYGSPENGGNIMHVHHATPENPFINYPFIYAKEFANLVKAAQTSASAVDTGKLTYKAEGNIDSRQGAAHVWVQVNFDPATSRNQNLFSIDYPNQDQLGFYWNYDDKGMRAYLRKGEPNKNIYPVLFVSNSPDWKAGEKHLVSVTWGDRLRIFVDGQFKSESGPFVGILDTPLANAEITLTGLGFGVDALKISSKSYNGGPVEQTADADTLLLDKYDNWQGEDKTMPQKISAGTDGLFSGKFNKNTDPSKAKFVFSSTPKKMGVNIYYTVRELSNHVVEMWPLRSLGDEIFSTGEVMLYTDKGAVMSTAGGGFPWLKEHLVNGYVPSWRQPLWNGMHDAAIGTQGLSRWHNYYVEGMQWLMKNTGVDGLYLDGIGYDREIMKRIVKVMHGSNPEYRTNFHAGNDYDYMERKVSPVNEYLEHFPFITNLWIGEMYDYALSPDYWFVEISGIPFGLTSEMLNYENGGNAYRGMLYGMTGRMHASVTAMWKFWDWFGIQNADWLGYWDQKCPVKTDDPNVLATVYRKRGKSLVSIASWADKKTNVKLKIDWKALGLDPARCSMYAPFISNFQDETRFAVDGAIPVDPGKGWLIVIEE